MRTECEGLFGCERDENAKCNLGNRKLLFVNKIESKKSERELLVRGKVIGSWSDNQFE